MGGVGGGRHLGLCVAVANPVRPHGQIEGRSTARALLHLCDEGGEARQPGRERGHRLKFVDQNREIVEHVVERARRLRDDAELDGAGEVERRDDQYWQDLNEVTVPRREELEVTLCGDELPQVGDGVGEPFRGERLLLRLSLVKGDRLGVVAHAHERVAKVGLALELLRVELPEGLAELDRAERSEPGVCENGEEEIRVD
mmetsp:Transcript_34486/g.75773  ORF Transcript_34486/g.75773 Transcript_34486/m.75773 type:complete len:200 (-) Transcript_34486:901-1500(-)